MSPATQFATFPSSASKPKSLKIGVIGGYFLDEEGIFSSSSSNSNSSSDAFG
jgi:hypothetical protein